ncbi:MAG: outer membrane protein assembly factor BamA [Alphaproteobacteria bacterium]|nr:outer membrane protein assembly factor BamA [Alphaproteobacteria bacterium]
MKKFHAAYLALLVTALLTFSAFAEVVKIISVSGNRRMDAESVRIMTDVKVGDNLDTAGLNRVAKKLQATGLFSKSSVEMSGGVLNIAVTESPVVNMVTIEGNDEISTDDLKKEIRLRERSAYDESAIGADVQRMLTVYQRKGFFGTKIEPKRIELDGGRVNIVYEITEGHPTRIKDIKFTGNKKFSSRTLRSEVLSREYAWWKFMASFDNYDEDRIQYDQQLLRQFYLRNGFVDFQIKSANGVFSPDRKYFSVTFDIHEGNRYKFGKMSVENPFPDVDDKKLMDLIKMDPGDYYNIDLVDGTISALRNAVAEQGYAFINIDVIPTKNDEARTIDLVFQIQKTNRIYINKVSILGNVRTFDSVIEHLLQVRSGDPFNRQEIESGRQRLMRTRYFKSVDMVPTRIEDSNLMNLDVKVEEQPTGELSGGLGWSNINGFMLDAGITENNFMGRGQTVQLRGSLAQYQKQAMFSFTEPYLFGRALSAGFDVNYTMYNYSSLGSLGYDRDSFMVAGRLGWKLTDNWTQMVRLSAAFDQNLDLHATGGQWQSVNLYTLGTNFRYHNLDTDFAQQTHDGVIGNIGVAYTGFGSTETFMRYDASITGLYKFLDNRWQLKSELGAGLLQPLTDDEYISRMYRYFLGGESLRGFNVAGVGSRNWAFRNYATGGLWKINGTTQLNFPVFIPDEYQVKGFVFTDYGILGRPPKKEFSYKPASAGFTCPDWNPGCENFIDQDWRVSYGIGVYWNTPMGPMNFSWGWPLLSKEYDREQKFLLSFATQF